MTVSPAIYNLLSNDVEVAALICQYQSSPAIFPTTMPGGTGAYPAIVFHTTGSKPIADSSKGPGNVFRQKVTLACIGKTPDDSSALSLAASQALLGSHQGVAGLNANVWLDDETESSEGWADGGDGYEVFQNEVTFDIYFRPVSS